MKNDEPVISNIPEIKSASSLSSPRGTEILFLIAFRCKHLSCSILLYTYIVSSVR